MKIKHIFGHLSVEKEVKLSDFILTNRLGGFYYSGLKTKYGGWFIFESDSFKILEGFDNTISHFENNFFQINRKGKVLEEYYFPFGKNSLVYGSSGEIDLVLDVRKSYDDRVWGRNYKVAEEDGRTIISFVKRTDKREDDSNGVREFEMFVVVSGIGEAVGDWVEKKYETDNKRKIKPSSRYVYQALKLKPGRYIISAGMDKEKVLAENKDVSENWRDLRNKQEKYLETFLDVHLEKFCAQIALDSLINSYNSKAMWAGLPWFFQEWSRDLMVSSKALMLEGEFDLVKKMLLGQLSLILEDGRLLTNKKSQLESADAIGWLFFRLGELIKSGKLNDEELKLVTGKLVFAIEKLLTFHTKNELAQNAALETWMDTVDRTGACIEIQALLLAMYKLGFELTKDRKYKVLEDKMKTEVKQQFWDGEILVDRLGDLVTRPNIFLACYIYPDLLSPGEWADAFEHVLERNWLNWGGLATIDVKDKRFVSNYSGEDNKSYHSGDSWFWVNNLAALVMARVDKKRFEKYIKGIFEASKNELLWSGCIGGCAELSSASGLKSEGCVLQAWSCATLLELMEELSDQN